MIKKREEEEYINKNSENNEIKIKFPDNEFEMLDWDKFMNGYLFHGKILLKKFVSYLMNHISREIKLGGKSVNYYLLLNLIKGIFNNVENCAEDIENILKYDINRPIFSVVLDNILDDSEFELNEYYNFFKILVQHDILIECIKNEDRGVIKRIIYLFKDSGEYSPEFIKHFIKKLEIEGDITLNEYYELEYVLISELSSKKLDKIQSSLESLLKTGYLGKYKTNDDIIKKLNKYKEKFNDDYILSLIGQFLQRCK